MSRSTLPLVLALAAWGAGPAFAAPVEPEDFAYGMPISATTVGTAYRFALPVEVYTQVASEDLRDIRVFNARGEMVPYELRQVTPQAVARPPGIALPLYPLHGDAHASLQGLQLTIHAEGAAVDLQAGSASPDPQVITSYVIDARQVTQPLAALQVQWAQGAPEFSGGLRIECSDDLGSWRLVSSEAAVVHLLTGGTELIQNRLELPATRAKFWRLSWVGKTAPFELEAVSAEIAIDLPATPQTQVLVSGSVVPGKEGELSFDLGARLPVTQVNVALPEPNSVLNLAVYSRAHTTDPWRVVTQGEFYRLSSGTTDRSNAAIHIPLNHDRYWLVRQTRPGAAPANLQFKASWDTMDVVFLAQGAAPFVLAYGSATATSSTVALEPLLHGVTVVAANTGASYELGGAERLQPPPKTLPWRMAALWAALAAGVVLLAWMAYRLSKELGTKPAK